jgi:RND family efflux transporter MFP subunit
MAERRRLEELRIDRSETTEESPWPRRLLLLGVSVVLVAVGAWWFLGTRAPELDMAPVAEARAGASAASVSVLDASGYVVARRQATVASKITGRLVEVTVEEGMAVEDGQVLARLDDANARRALELAEARVAAARSTLDEIEVRLHEADLTLGRTRELSKQGVASRSDLDAAEAARNSFAARLSATRDEAFAGVAVSKDAQPGEIVSPVSAGGGFTRTGVATIVDMGSLEIEVDVNESYIQRVRAGQPVVATLQAYPEWKIPAHVITIVPAGDRQKATVKVRIAFDELGDPRLLPDMGVKVGFQAEQDGQGSARAKLLVPERALRRERDGGIVFVWHDGRVERRAVAVGGTGADGVEVLSGLRAGETVVLDPPADLADGSRVRRR